MNVFAKFDEIPSMILQGIKETKCYGHTVGVGRSDNVKTVYPPTNTECGGINIDLFDYAPIFKSLNYSLTTKIQVRISGRFNTGI